MRVRMLIKISGSRNGKAWPAIGETLEVPEEEAATLAVLGYAVLDPAPRPPAEKAVRSPRGERRISKD